MSETYASVSDEFGYGDSMRDELVHEVVALRLQVANQAEFLVAARREAETVTRERDESRAALEDVRRVEAWLRGDASRSLQKSVGQFVARDDDYANPRSLYADSLESLGRALAQEAPPCRYCNGQGWDAVDGGNGEPIQVGCQFCNGTGTLAQEEGNAT